MLPEKIVRVALLLANFFSRLTTSYYIKFGLASQSLNFVLRLLYFSVLLSYVFLRDSKKLFKLKSRSKS